MEQEQLDAARWRYALARPFALGLLARGGWLLLLGELGSMVGGLTVAGLALVLLGLRRLGRIQRGRPGPSWIRAGMLLTFTYLVVTLAYLFAGPEEQLWRIVTDTMAILFCLSALGITVQLAGICRQLQLDRSASGWESVTVLLLSLQLVPQVIWRSSMIWFLLDGGQPELRMGWVELVITVVLSIPLFRFQRAAWRTRKGANSQADSGLTVSTEASVPASRSLFMRCLRAGLVSIAISSLLAGNYANVLHEQSDHEVKRDALDEIMDEVVEEIDEVIRAELIEEARAREDLYPLWKDALAAPGHAVMMRVTGTYGSSWESGYLGPNESTWVARYHFGTTASQVREEMGALNVPAEALNVTVRCYRPITLLPSGVRIEVTDSSAPYNDLFVESLRRRLGERGWSFEMGAAK